LGLGEETVREEACRREGSLPLVEDRHRREVHTAHDMGGVLHIVDPSFSMGKYAPERRAERNNKIFHIANAIALDNCTKYL
jgi:hypothetical protein